MPRKARYCRGHSLGLTALRCQAFLPGRCKSEALAFSQKLLNMIKLRLTPSILTLHCHLHLLQAANCCRNSRLVVDENDLKWVKKLKKITLY